MALDFGGITFNPASSALLPVTELALVHHRGIAESNIEGFAYTRRFGKLGLGGAIQYLYTPYTLYDAWGDAQGTTYISEGVAALNTSYIFFSNYYLGDFSLGANLKGAFRIVPIASDSYQSLTSFAADVGILGQFNFLKPYVSAKRNLSIGLAMKNLGVVSEDEDLPSLFSAGIAYSPLAPLLLSFDYNQPFTLKSGIPADAWYFAWGADLKVADFLSLQAGCFYHRNNPELSLGGMVNLQQFSILTSYTLELNSDMKPFGRFSLEVKLNMGDEGRRNLQQKAEAYYLSGLEAYAKGDMDTALRDWESALELDPGFQPAREFLETTRELLKLYDEIEKTQQPPIGLESETDFPHCSSASRHSSITPSSLKSLI